MSVIGRYYRSLREVETPLTKAAKVEYAKGRNDPLTEDLGAGYSSDNGSQPKAHLRKSLAPGTPTASLPPWITDPAALWPDDAQDWPGCVCVARFRSSAAPLVTELLVRERVSYYFPSERVRREYRRAGGGIDRQEYTRALFPGLMIIGDGIRGHEAARVIGSRYSNTIYGFITVSSASAVPFHEQILSVARLLSQDPALRVVKGMLPGRRVHVVSGFARGAVGVLVADRGGHRFAVNLPLFGRAVETEIDVECLEPADDEPDA